MWDGQAIKPWESNIDIWWLVGRPSSHSFHYSLITLCQRWTRQIWSKNLLPVLQKYALLLFLGHYLFLPFTNFNFCTIIIFGVVFLLFCYLYLCLPLLLGDVEVSRDSSHKNQGTREEYRRTFLEDTGDLEWGRRGVLRLRSWAFVHEPLHGPLWVSQTRGLPLRPKLWKANRSLSQKDWRCVSVCHLFSALRVVVC